MTHKLIQECWKHRYNKRTEQESVNYHSNMLEAKIVLEEKLIVSIGYRMRQVFLFFSFHKPGQVLCSCLFIKLVSHGLHTLYPRKPFIKHCTK